MNKIHLVLLTFDIYFNDSDYGDSYAGEGQAILKGCVTEDAANKFIESHTEALKLATSGKLINTGKLNPELLMQFKTIDQHIGQDAKNVKMIVKELAIEN